jgi:hypothetical protein
MSIPKGDNHMRMPRGVNLMTLPREDNHMSIQRETKERYMSHDVRKDTINKRLSTTVEYYLSEKDACYCDWLCIVYICE